MNELEKHTEKRAKTKVPKFEEAAGFYTSDKNSNRMAKIRSKNTKAEILLRKALWNLNYRYRLHSNNIIGKPDLIFSKKKLVVFVDGGFWHGYNWEIQKQKLANNANKGYWIPKIERNIERDLEVTNALIKSGWTVVRFWEHEVEKNLQECIILISILLKL